MCDSHKATSRKAQHMTLKFRPLAVVSVHTITPLWSVLYASLQHLGVAVNTICSCCNLKGLQPHQLPIWQVIRLCCIVTGIGYHWYAAFGSEGRKSVRGSPENVLMLSCRTYC